MRRPVGFTILELLVTLAIAALLSGIVALSIASQIHGAQMRDVVAVIADLDRSMRVEAMDFGRRGSLVFDLANGTLVRTVDIEGKEQRAAHYTLPSRLRLARYWRQGAASQGSRHVLRIPCTSDGHAPSYALALEDPRGERTYLVFAGLTGQMKEVDDVQSVEAIFTTLRGDDTR